MKRLILSILLSASVASADSSTMLMSAFGDQCFSAGEQSTQANRQAQELRSAIEAIRSDRQRCASVVGAYDAFQQSLQSFNGMDRASRIATLESGIQDMSSALVQERDLGAQGDQSYIAELQSALNAKRLELLNLRQSRDIRDRPVQISALRDVYGYSTALMEAVARNTACTEGHPGLGAQIGGQLVSLVANFGSSLVSGGILAGASLISRLVSFFSGQGLSREINRLNQTARTNAVGCAIEGISRTYCQARDYIALINSRMEAGTCERCDQQDAGLRILRTDLESYADWVRRLSAGSPAATQGQASDRNRANVLQQQSDSFNNSIDAVLSEGIRDANESEDKVLARQALANSLSTQISRSVSTMNCGGNGCTNEPGFLGRVFSADPECGPMAFVYSGGTTRQCDKQPGEECRTCINRVFQGRPPEIEQMQSAVTLVKTEGQREVSRLRQRYIETNPLAAISEADSPSASNRSARDFLVNTRAYFEAALSNPQSTTARPGALRQEVTEARDRITRALAILDRNGGYTAEDVTTLANELIPANTLFFISDTLNRLVQREYSAALTNGNENLPVQAMAQYSVRETVAQLLAQYRSPTQAQTQAESAKTQSRQTMVSVANVFGENMERSILDLAQTNQSPTLLAVNCLRYAMMATTIPRPVQTACANTSLTGGQGTNQSFTVRYSEIASAPPDKRMCAIYDFARREQVVRRGRQ